MSTVTEPPTSAVQWRRTWRRDATLAASRRILNSICGRYRVVISRSLYRPRRSKRDKGGIADMVYSEIYLPPEGNATWGCWSLIGRHRKADAAKLACEKHARRRA